MKMSEFVKVFKKMNKRQLLLFIITFAGMIYFVNLVFLLYDNPYSLYILVPYVWVISLIFPFSIPIKWFSDNKRGGVGFLYKGEEIGFLKWLN